MAFWGLGGGHFWRLVVLVVLEWGESGDLGSAFWYVGNSKCDAENLLEILSKLMTEMDGYLATSIYAAVFVTACFSAVYNTGGVLQDVQKNSISSPHCLSPSFILNTVPCWRIASCHSVHTSADFWVSLEKESKDLD